MCLTVPSMQSTVQLPPHNLNTVIEGYQESLRQTAQDLAKNLSHNAVSRIEHDKQLATSIDFIPSPLFDQTPPQANQFGDESLLSSGTTPQNSFHSQTSVRLVIEKKNTAIFLQLSKQTIYPNHPSSLPRLFNKKSLTAYGMAIGVRW